MLEQTVTVTLLNTLKRNSEPQFQCCSFCLVVSTFYQHICHLFMQNKQLFHVQDNKSKILWTDCRVCHLKRAALLFLPYLTIAFSSCSRFFRSYYWTYASRMSLSLIIKWGGQEYTITSLSEEDTVLDLKQSLKGLTGVLPERQKLLGLKMKGNCSYYLFVVDVPEMFKDRHPLSLARMHLQTGHLPPRSSFWKSIGISYITWYCLLSIHLMTDLEVQQR